MAQILKYFTKLFNTEGSEMLLTLIWCIENFYKIDYLVDFVSLLLFVKCVSYQSFVI